MQDDTAQPLPAPDPESAAHSALVREHIAGTIDRAGGTISFAEYMHQALYAPALGYYNAGTMKFGREGDFVTAPEVSALFGRVLARQCAGALGEIDGASILELGAGSGKLALDVMNKLAELDALPDEYLILEVSAELRDRQAGLLGRQLPELLDRVRWIADWPSDFRGIVIANEVADALPVERFAIRPGGVMQLCVGRDRENFQTTERPAPDYLVTAVEEIERSIGRKLPVGYVSDVCCAIPGWIAGLAAALLEGIVFLFDYGVSRREYYAEDRSGGWLRCHFRQFAHNNPLILPGIQDITSWVDFTAIASASVAAGLDILGYTPQAQFLIAGGLQEEISGFTELGTGARLRMAGEVKLLTLPGEMGEHFKCIGLGRGVALSVPAVSHFDRTATL